MFNSNPKLHFATEVVSLATPGYIDPDLLAMDFDILVIPGDLGAPLPISIPALASIGKPVVVVLGNKDIRQARGCANTLSEQVALAKELSKGTKVVVLEKEVATVAGIRFVGVHLGFGVLGHHPVLMRYFINQYSDLHTINYADLESTAALRQHAQWLFHHKRAILETDPQPKLGNPAYHASLCVAYHEACLRWLKATLFQPYAGFTVVVTHSSPVEEFENIAQEDLVLLLQDYVRHDYDGGRFALNTNQALQSQAFNGHIWAFGQAQRNAIKASTTGTLLVACGKSLGLDPRWLNPLTIPAAVRHVALAKVQSTQAEIKSTVAALSQIAPLMANSQSPALTLLAKTQAQQAAITLITADCLIPLKSSKWARTCESIRRDLHQGHGATKLLPKLSRICEAAAEDMVAMPSDVRKARQHVAQVILQWLSYMGFSGYEIPTDTISQIETNTLNLGFYVLPEDETPLDDDALELLTAQVQLVVWQALKRLYPLKKLTVLVEFREF